MHRERGPRDADARSCDGGPGRSPARRAGTGREEITADLATPCTPLRDAERARKGQRLKYISYS